MKNIIKAALLTSLALSLPAQAHDFWIHPESFEISAPEKLDVALRIGHTEDQSDWPANPARIINFFSLSRNGITDQQNAITETTDSKTYPIKLSGEGTHVLVIQSNHAVSKLPADKFNAYVDEEGIFPIKLDRIRRSASSEEGREKYSRRGKSIVQVGELHPDDYFVTRPLGLTLEITPMQHPAKLEDDDPVKVQVRYRGAPISNAMIHVVSLDGQDAPDPLKTDKNGYASAKLQSGEWMFHTIWSSPLPEGGDVDYDTTFSSLSFRRP